MGVMFFLNHLNYILMAKKSKGKPAIGKDETPKLPYSNYNVGEYFDGEIIGQIFSSHKDFLIYREEDACNVSVYYPDENIEYSKNLSKISHKTAVLKGCVCNKLEHKKYNSRIAVMYREALRGNSETAEAIIDAILKDAPIFKRNLARIFYLISCFSVVLFMIILSVLQDTIFQFDYLIPYLKIMLYGSLGGIISVTISIKKLNLDFDFYNWSQLIYGAFRIILAIISAIIAYVLIKSDLIFSKLDSTNIYLYYVLAVMAGFSETWIPNTLKKLQKE